MQFDFVVSSSCVDKQTTGNRISIYRQGKRKKKKGGSELTKSDREHRTHRSKVKEKIDKQIRKWVASIASHKQEWKVVVKYRNYNHRPAISFWFVPQGHPAGSLLLVGLLTGVR
jgi:hypothetical protein